jgi:tRNA (guanosine-2'-O-)-methyltransferase
VTLRRHSLTARAPARHAPPAELSPELVVRALAPYLSEARKRRIEHVLRSRLGWITVVLENLYDPHNGAAVLRSCEAFGLLHVHVVEGGEAFAFSRKVSQSAHKWLAVHLHRSFGNCADLLGRAGFELWAALPPPLRGGPAPTPFNAIALDRPVALVLGNEHAGLSEAARARCTRSFSIPLSGFTESLNLSVAAAVAIAETALRRRALLGGEPELPAAARDRLRAAYYALSTPHAAKLVHAALTSGAARPTMEPCTPHP